MPYCIRLLSSRKAATMLSSTTPRTSMPTRRMTSKSYLMLCPTFRIAASSRIGLTAASTVSAAKNCEPSGPLVGT